MIRKAGRVILWFLVLATMALWLASHYLPEFSHWKLGDLTLRETERCALVFVPKGKLGLDVACRNKWKPVSPATAAERAQREIWAKGIGTPDPGALLGLRHVKKHFSRWGLLIQLDVGHCFDDNANATYESERVDIQCRAPFWMILTFFSAYPVADLLRGAVRRRRRRRRGCCPRCGYNLTGNVSGVCPECGSEVKQS